MPHIIAEAVPASLPVVATRDNASEEQIVDGVSGVFVPRASQVGLASADNRRVMSGPVRFQGLLEQLLGYIGLADFALGLAFLAIAAVLTVYWTRVAAAVSSRTFVVVLVLFAAAQGCAHLWNAVTGESAPGIGRILDTVAVLTAIVLALLLPRALAHLTQLSEAARNAAEAEARVRVRDEFLSIAAHELKTPVTSIAGFGQLVAQLIESGEAQTNPAGLLRRVRVQQESIKRLSLLIDQLLDYSRFERGALRLGITTVDLARLVHDAARDVEYRHGGGRIRISGPPEVLAQADANRIYQVLVNLLDNAAKFTSGQIDVQLSTQNPHRVEVRVRDYGGGIAEAMLPEIFAPFKRATNTYVEGLGLGLAISKNIVELHHGRLSVQNSVDGGAEFQFWIPSDAGVDGSSLEP